jgi:acid phosphatase class B
MKNLSILVFVIICKLSLSAQEITVKEKNEKIAGANNPVLTVLIYEADLSTVEKSWKSLMKDYKAKVSDKAEIFADNAVISDISANTIDVYAIVEKYDKGIIRLIVAIDLKGVFLSSSTHSKEYKAAEKIIKQFAVNTSKNAVEAELEKAKDKQKELENNISCLIKKNEKLHKQIEEYKNKITEAEKDIETNINDQDAASKAIETQKNTVEEVSKKNQKIQ